MNVIENEIRDAIEKELCGANERFPLFASAHEAIAVIAEERDEAHNELISVELFWKYAWDAVKANNLKSAYDFIARMKFAAERLAIEACQVAAMCEKAFQSRDVKEDEKGAE